MAFKSQLKKDDLDLRFNYEPILGTHPTAVDWSLDFLGKSLRLPIWVSSMTGGSSLSRTINYNLAKACHDFGMGMGLGSCRSLLYSDESLEDFAVRSIIGNDLPLYGNLGIAQVEQLIQQNATDRINKLVDKLELDGIIIHVNPLQEAFQPEGDQFTQTPLEIITKLLDSTDVPLMVKEVGQGMGPASLRALLQLPLQAIDFAASGGTNFALLELLRETQGTSDLEPLVKVGHTGLDMVQSVNDLVDELGTDLRCSQVIISGGVRDFLDGYYLMKKLNLPSIYGQASGFLRHAMGDYEELHRYVSDQARGLALAKAYLRVK